jgi:hypothetical protein
LSFLPYLFLFSFFLPLLSNEIIRIIRWIVTTLILISSVRVPGYNSDTLYYFGPWV